MSRAEARGRFRLEGNVDLVNGVMPIVSAGIATMSVV